MRIRRRLGEEGDGAMGLKEDDIIESPLVTRQIANAQRKVEAHNFDIRKNLLDFDDVNNDQRNHLRPAQTSCWKPSEQYQGQRRRHPPRRGEPHGVALRAAGVDRRAVDPAGAGGRTGR